MMRSASQLLVLSGNEQWVDSDKNASLDLVTSTQKDKLQLNDDLMFSLNFKRRGSIPDNLIVFVFVFDKYDNKIVFVFLFDKYDDERMSISDAAGALLFDWSSRLERISTNCQGHSQ